jgi:hypothetical protein
VTRVLEQLVSSSPGAGPSTRPTSSNHDLRRIDGYDSCGGTARRRLL